MSWSWWSSNRKKGLNFTSNSSRKRSKIIYCMTMVLKRYCFLLIWRYILVWTTDRTWLKYMIRIWGMLPDLRPENKCMVDVFLRSLTLIIVKWRWGWELSLPMKPWSLFICLILSIRIRISFKPLASTNSSFHSPNPWKKYTIFRWSISGWLCLTSLISFSSLIWKKWGSNHRKS